MPDIDLGIFEDRKVSSTTIAIRNTGHGLEESMATDPMLMHHGETIYVVLECEVEKVRFDPIADTDNVSRVHMLKAGTATVVTGELVREHVRQQYERNKARKDAESGQGRLGEDPDFDPVSGERRNPETGEWEYPPPDGKPLDAGTADEVL